MNEYQKQRFTKRIISCLFHNLAGKKIAVLGFAFKKDTSDTRESPAITLVGNFVAERAQVAIFDPQVKKQQIWRELIDDGGDPQTLERSILVCDSAYEACAGVDAVVIATEWDEFSNKTDNESRPIVPTSTVLRELSPNRVLQAKVLSPPTKPKRSFLSLSPPKSRMENRTFDSMPSIEDQLDQMNLAAEASSEPKRLDWARIARSMRKPMFVFDGRNILDASKLEQLGFRVEAIGRASVVARDLHD